MRLATCTFLAALVLAGCGAPGTGPGGTIIYNIDAPRGRASEVRAALQGGARVAVLGTPTDGASAEAVAAALRAPAKFGGGGFVAVPAESRDPRIVLAFSRSSPAALCAGTAGSGAGGIVTAALCTGTSPLASAVMESPALTGPGNPGFAEAMRMLLSAMLDTQAVGGAPR